jgi:hypothetical protein
MGTQGEVQLSFHTDHMLPPSAEVKNVWELYFLSPQVPPLHIVDSFNFYSNIAELLCDEPLGNVMLQK